MYAMSSRTERRFIASPEGRGLLEEAITIGSTMLQYDIINYYLDNHAGEFSMVVNGSPRLRVRIYKAEKWMFGFIEQKKQSSRDATSKLRWSLMASGSLLMTLIPEMK